MRILIALIVAIALIASVVYYSQNRAQSPAMEGSSPEPLTQTEALESSPSASPVTSYTLADVAEHSTKDDCWIAIEGKVYNVTDFIASGLHPGKEAILQGCGKDATTLFNTRPMAKSPSPHSETARANLPRFYIGDLAQ